MENRAQICKPGDFSPGQVQEFMGAFGRAGGTPGLLQSAIENKEKMVEVVSALEEGLPYANCESKYGYPEGFLIRSVTEQVETLLKYFPYLDASHVKEKAKWGYFKEMLPKGAEGWAVIPKWARVTKYYSWALRRVFELLVENSQFEYPRKVCANLTSDYLRLEKETISTQAILNEDDGDFWVFPFQFGKRWAGHSQLKAHSRFAKSEFGLGPYEVGILLLTHKDRITGPNQLYISCTGCGYRESKSSGFRFYLYFRWDEGNDSLLLGGNRFDIDEEFLGTASGFLI